MDEVELVGPGPLICDIFDLEDAIWRRPFVRWWIEVNAVDGNVRKPIGYIQSPCLLCQSASEWLRALREYTFAGPGSQVENVLGSG